MYLMGKTHHLPHRAPGPFIDVQYKTTQVQDHRFILT